MRRSSQLHPRGTVCDSASVAICLTLDRDFGCNCQRKRDIRRSNSVAFGMMTGTLQQALSGSQMASGSAHTPSQSQAPVINSLAAISNADIVARRNSLAPTPIAAVTLANGPQSTQGSAAPATASDQQIKDSRRRSTTTAAPMPPQSAVHGLASVPSILTPSTSDKTGSAALQASASPSNPSNVSDVSNQAPIDTAAAPATAVASPTHGVVWQADADSVECNVCAKLFSIVRRIHHCRQW